MSRGQRPRKIFTTKGAILSIFHEEGLNINFITLAKFIQLCKLTLTPKHHYYGLLDNSRPIQVELTYSSIIGIALLLNSKHKKNAHAYLKGCE